MKHALVVGVVAAAIAAAVTPARAALMLGPDAATEGLTYTLTASTTGNPLVDNFVLVIAGQNTAADTRGGRTGINAFAFTNPTGGVASATVTAPPNFTFLAGGLNSTGCDGSGGFFCFDNTTIPPTPVALVSSPITIDFTATLNSGTWASWAPSFKIDWVGAFNNYSLVSEAIPVNPGGTPPPAPEPASIAILASALLGLGLVVRRRRR